MLKQGRFVIFAFPLFYSLWGSKNTQMPGKKGTESVIATRLFVRPKC